MALTQTKMLRYLERRLGFKFTDIEFDAEDLKDIIDSTTLPLFSKYFPYQTRIPVKTRVEGYQTRYWLETDLDILNVNKVYPFDLYNTPGNAGGGLSTAMAGSGLAPKMSASGGSSIIDSQYQADQNSYASNPMTFTYYAPNQVEFSMDMGTSGILVEVNAIHPDHLATIPLNLQNDFQILALADVAESIIPIRSRFQNLQTTFGSIELMVDQLQTYVEARQEIIERYRTGVLRTGHRRKVYLA